MRYITFSVLISVAFLILSQQALAQRPQDAGNQETRRQQLLENTQNRRSDAEAMREEIRVQRESTREEMKLQREEFKEKMTLMREEMREKMLQQRTEFREKLSMIRDQRKKTTAERINQNLATINQNRTATMAHALDRLDGVLERLTETAAMLNTQGHDTSAIDEAILAAEEAIEAARIAVQEQAEKIYTAEVTSEATLGQAMSNVFNQLREDLKATYDTLNDAKETVRNVAKALAQIRSNTPDEATQSGELN